MLRNRLKELMSERNLKASRLANDISNLSRNTINATANNKGKMLQLETINSLCEYLGITPNDFFEYLPFDVDIKVDIDDEHLEVPDTNFATGWIVKPFFLNLYITKKSNSQLSGFSLKTFELSILSPEDIVFDYTDDIADGLEGDYVYKEKPDRQIKSEWDILIGNPPTEHILDEQKAFFLDFWNKELTPGFQTIIQEEIRLKVADFLENQIIPNAQFIDWKEFSFHLNYRFDETNVDFTNCPKGKIKIDPFNTFPGIPF